MILMWLMAGLVFWLISFAAIGVLIAFGAFLLYEEYFPGNLNSGINAARVKYLDFLFRNRVLLTCVSIFCILLALYLLWIILSKGKIIIRITPLISESFKISIKKTLLILLSLFIIVLQILTFYVGIVVIGKLVSSGEEIRDNEKGQPFPEFRKT